MRALLFIPLLLVPLAGLSSRWLLRRRAEYHRGLLLDLLPPDGAAIDLQAWTIFFRSLFAMAAPRWKRWLLGQPWISLELWAAEGSVRACCWLHARLEMLVTSQLRSALPAIEIRPAEAGSNLPPTAARTRLRLERDPPYPLAHPRPEPLRSVVNALASSSEGVVQVLLMPDVGWQARACEQLDSLAGIRAPSSGLAAVLRGAIDGLFDLLLAKPGAPPQRSKPSHLHPLPPADKAPQPGYRCQIRLRVAAATRAEARGRMHSLTGLAD